MLLEMTVNGVLHQLDVDPGCRLLDLLREQLSLTSVKEGCGEGECGSCTVLLDGKAICACLVLASQVQNCEIKTVEGLSMDGKLNPLQEVFIKKGAVQCGYCTPGMLMSANALLAIKTNPTRSEIKTAIAGNLCRCTGYNKIVDAIEYAARFKN